jgi:hypothetical protein
MGFIELDFRIDERSLVEDARYDPATADPAVLEATYFMAPFRFSIHGVALLSVDHRLPLLGFACGFCDVVANARRGTTHTCSSAGGGNLTLQRYGESMRISSSRDSVDGSRDPRTGIRHPVLA